MIKHNQLQKDLYRRLVNLIPEIEHVNSHSCLELGNGLKANVKIRVDTHIPNKRVRFDLVRDVYLPVNLSNKKERSYASGVPGPYIHFNFNLQTKSVEVLWVCDLRPDELYSNSKWSDHQSKGFTTSENKIKESMDLYFDKLLCELETANFVFLPKRVRKISLV